jgi:hypothetical protein
MDVSVKAQHDKQFEDQNGNALRVSGRVRKPLVLSMEDLSSMKTEVLEDLFVVCGSGDPKGNIGSCRGVLIERIIQMADVIKEEHDDTKKMFLVASADDGYKVVFSWQEVFNTPVGGGILILLEKDGKPLDPERKRVDLISAEDYFMGSRYVKGLTNIEVAIAG